MVMIQAGARRCCARCYSAKGPNCQCLCGGVNHGQGVIKAASNAYGMRDRILREATGQLSLELGAVRS